MSNTPFAQESYKALDVSVAPMNSAIYVQIETRGGPTPPPLADGESRVIDLECCGLHWIFHVFKRGHGDFQKLPKVIRNANHQSRRCISLHYVAKHAEIAKPKEERKKRPRADASNAALPVAAAAAAAGQSAAAVISSDQDELQEEVDTPFSKRLRVEHAYAPMETRAQWTVSTAPLVDTKTPSSDGCLTHDVSTAMVAATSAGPSHSAAAAASNMDIPRPHPAVISESARQPARDQLLLAPHYATSTAQQQLVPVLHAVITRAQPQLQLQQQQQLAAMNQPAADAVKAFSTFRNKPDQPIQLPCLMQLDFCDAKTGPHQVLAVLLWKDNCAKVPETAKELSKLTSAKDEFFTTLPPISRSREITRRDLCLHKILLVTPASSPVAHLTGEMFSSFFESTSRLVGINAGHSLCPLQAWHLINQPQVSMACMMANQGFFPPDMREILSTPAPTLYQLLSDNTNSRNEPLLRLTPVQPLRKIHPLIPCINDPAEARRVEAGELQESDCRSLTFAAATEEAEEEEEDEQPPKLPVWVMRSRIAYRNRYERWERMYRLCDMTTRDLWASLCTNECNDLECCPSADTTPGLSHRCKHGHQHIPYKTKAAVAGQAARSENRRASAENKKSAEEHLANELKANDDRMDPMFFFPVQSDTELLRRSGPPVARSKWSCRIQFDGLKTNIELKIVRVLGGRLAQLVLLALMAAEHPTHDEELNDAYKIIQQANVLDTVLKLDTIMGGRNPWEPQPLHCQSMADYKALTLPLQWVRKDSAGKICASMTRSITRPMRIVLSKRCSSAIAATLLNPPLMLEAR